MKSDLLKCEGYQLAILGSMLSKGKVNYDKLIDASKGVIDCELKERGDNLSTKLAGADGGHNKFLEQIQYWIVIDAPLYFWKQLDTYRIGVSKSSESTMFKMWKKGLTNEDFENPELIFKETIDRLNEQIKEYMETNDNELFVSIISNLPDGFLQTRLLNINAKSLRNIYFQRKNHKLKEWKEFCKFIETLPYSELITATI